MVMGKDLSLTTSTSGLVQQWPGPHEGFTCTSVSSVPGTLEMLQDSMCHALLDTQFLPMVKRTDYPTQLRCQPVLNRLCPPEDLGAVRLAVPSAPSVLASGP